MSNLGGISLLLPIGSTLDLTPPRRPGVTDLQVAPIQDDMDYPPAAGMPCAGEFNNGDALIAALGKTISLLEISVTYSAGSPGLEMFSSASNVPVTATFTIARHAGGAASGDIDITWPAGTFPSAVSEPKASINGTTPGLICVSRITNGIRVITQNSAGAATDLPFCATLL